MTPVRKVQVRDVPDGTHAVLVRRAAAEGRSLQEYLLALLNEHAAYPTVADVMTRAGQRSGSRATVDDVVALVRADRDGR